MNRTSDLAIPSYILTYTSFQALALTNEKRQRLGPSDKLVEHVHAARDGKVGQEYPSTHTIAVLYS